jgi:hypothetical protein
MSDYQTIVEWDDEVDEQMAKNAMQLLSQAYPGHPWHVHVGQGILSIKHMKMSGKMGMVLHYKKVAGDADALKRGVVFSGGELLERAGISRGTYNGQVIKSVEGILQKDMVHG